mmetsp:Transcript_6986/g.10235  ORF Transcript_6986/g.10235 Transcript_6986/m.10235 type:complete len:166 (-) Transcript_6986:89-586(-)
MKVNMKRGDKSTSTLIPVMLYMVLGAAALQTFRCLFTTSSSSSSSSKQQGLRSTPQPGNAWTLSVKLTFTDQSDLTYILNEWKAVTEYCKKHESSFLYHYEAGISDQNPLELHMLERYRTKEDYLNIHKKGDAFLKFRPKLKALQDARKVVIEGFSYLEGGHGFV